MQEKSNVCLPKFSFCCRISDRSPQSGRLTARKRAAKKIQVFLQNPAGNPSSPDVLIEFLFHSYYNLTVHKHEQQQNARGALFAGDFCKHVIMRPAGQTPGTAFPAASQLNQEESS